MPGYDTFDRVFARLDPDVFECCFRRWTSAITSELGGPLAIDGTTLLRSFDRAAGMPRSTRSVCGVGGACERGLVFGQQVVEKKINEITAFPKLLELLDHK